MAHSRSSAAGTVASDQRMTHSGSVLLYATGWARQTVDVRHFPAELFFLALSLVTFQTESVTLVTH
jgi:hypothetical protein